MLEYSLSILIFDICAEIYDWIPDIHPTLVQGLNTWAQISNHGRACTQVLLLRKAELGFFHF
jgi:hypothetical protein